MKYKWLTKDKNHISDGFLDVCYGSEIIARLLINRDIDTVEKAKEYLDPKFYKESAPEEIPQLVTAKDRIIEAINKKEKITIFGDYDVDGVTSTSCLFITLKQFTDNVDFYIPSRLTEGYGLNSEAVKKIAGKGVACNAPTKLLITCDCGITNRKEIELANSLGMDVIVTDHHSLPEVLPPAHAVLNPKLLPADHKLHWLPGVGVAYKLCQAIIKEMGTEGRWDGRIELLDLVTLGMIADLAPLVDENRYLVQIGLEKLAKTKKIGLQELLRLCGFLGQDSTADHIGFGIAPRINAVGRLTDANLAVKLFTTNDLLEAVQLATELDVQNKERQILCEETTKEAIEMAENKTAKDKCIVLAKEGWHHGVIGIVASRIVEKYHLPTILICIDKEENIARGSGRSINGFDIIETVTSCSKHLEKFGGHKAACGLSIKPENIGNFILDFKEITNSILGSEDINPILKIDLPLPVLEVDFDLLNKINKLAPFGLANRMPVFESNELEIAGIRTIGKDGKHLKLYVKENNTTSKIFEALIWNHDSNVELNVGDKIKIAYTPKINNFNGATSVQLEVKDLEKKTGVKEARDSKESLLFDYRNKTNEAIETLSKIKTIFFAETKQKDFLPLKTYSRHKLTSCKTLVLLETPPDEKAFLEIIEKTDPEKIYLSFSEDLDINPNEIIKRLIGMLKYTTSNKNSSVKEIELQSALGLNKPALSYAMEVLVRTGVLSYTKENGELKINIMTPKRENFSELIEYNLFVSELKKIYQFKKWLLETNIEDIREKIISSQMVLL